jgi:acyl carrier protein
VHTHTDAGERVESPETTIAQGGGNASAVWNRHPKASVHRHRKRLGLSDETTVSAPGTWTARRLADPTVTAIGGAPLAACVAALHLLAQSLCADEESLVAVFRTSPDAARDATLAASYVYAEAEDDVASVRAQVERCLEREERIAAAHVPALSTARNLPVFFVVQGTDAPSAPVALAIDDGGTTLRLGIAPEVRRFPDPAATLEILEDLLLALGDAGRDIGALNATILSRVALPGTDGGAIDALANEVAGLWADLLETDTARIRPETSYFELGGTSLNAFKLVATVRNRFEVEINIREIIDHDTLSAFAALIERKRRDA